MLEVEKIDVFYGTLQALWGVSLEVGDGDLVALIGANGAGKSTIVETISSLITPASGSVKFSGVRLDKEPAHKVVAMGVCLIPEERGIFPGMSVMENLELGAFTPQSRRVRLRAFPSPRSTKKTGRRDNERRGAADARHSPGSHGETQIIDV